MKKGVVFLFTVAFLNFSFAQELTHSQKKEWRKALKIMVKDDQHYRVLMAENTIYNNDSIWNLQSISDSINKSRFIQLTKKHGFPIT